jgi:precorrin-6B methylase 2
MCPSTAVLLPHSLPSRKDTNVMVWIHAINESAASEFAEDVLNPMNPEKLRTLGRRIRLRPDHRILDVGAGRCGPALVLAREFGCSVTAVEPYADFLEAARERVARAGLTDRFELVLSTGADFGIEPERYDAAMCIGATWAWGGLDGTLKALAPGVRSGGHVVAGEVYFVPGQTSSDANPEATLSDVLEAFESNGLSVITLIRSTTDDWDTYHSIQATSLLDWLETNPEHVDADNVRRWRREAVERCSSRPFGWALVAGRKP